MLSDPRGIYNRTEEFNIGRISLDRSVGYGGSSQSMRYDYPAGSGRDYTISRMIDLENGTTEVWVEAVVRFSSNYTLQGNGQGAGAALKLLHTVVRGPSGRFGLNFEGGDDSVVRAEGPNDAYEQLYIWPKPPTAPVSSSLFDGEWHVIRHHIRLGSNDFHEFWIDGVYQGSATGRTSANELWGVSLARNLNMLSNRNMSMWWGEVGVWYSDPGW